MRHRFFPLWALGLVLALVSPSLSFASLFETLQSAATATGNGVPLTVNNKGTVGVAVTGTFVGTVTFQGSTNGNTTWNSVNCTTIDTLLTATTTSTTGQFTCNTAGLTGFRAQISSYTSGSITVTGFPTEVGGGGGTGGGGAGGSTPTLAGCWANVSQPSYTEALLSNLSCTLTGLLRVSVEAFTVLLSCEDQSNTLCMVSGGPVRPFTLMTGVTTNSTSATQIIHSGGKTFMASVTGTGSVSVTVDIYGDMTNTTTNGQWLCTILPSGTTTDTKRCLNQITLDFPYYHAVTSGISGTGATVEVVAMQGVMGSPQAEWRWSGEKTADALIKTGQGTLRCVIISQHDAAPTAGTISINDATSAGTGTVIKEWVLTTAVFTPIQFCPETGFTTGLYFDFTTTADVDVAASYR